MSSLRALAEEYVEYAERVAGGGGDNLRLLEEARAVLRLRAEGRLEEVLRTLARTYGGCIACKYSKPAWPQSLSLLARTCALGLERVKCNSWEPL